MKITKRQLRRIIKEELSFDNAAYESGRHAARMVAAGEGDIDRERFDNDRSYAAGVDFEQEEQDRTLSWQGDRMPYDEAAIVTRRQLGRIIRETTATGPTREDRLARLASDILRHYDAIASDVGEIHVDDLIDHWVGQGNPDPGPKVRAELIRQNYGEEYLR